MKTETKDNLIIGILAFILIFVGLAMCEQQASEQFPELRFWDVETEKDFVRCLQNPNDYDLSDSNIRGYINDNSENFHVVKLTVYNLDTLQCGPRPFITADGTEIDESLETKINQGKIKWCAVSRDLIKKYPFGTKLKINMFGQDEIYIVRDLTAKAWKGKEIQNTIDLLMPIDINKGKKDYSLVERVD